ncbi:thioesterase superfamily protein [Salinisphaera dokdonensis CL-ES53]|uniref:Thioesterase superfamily protein n=1 Tax=Salinisphaera dokdonensis CL-ES53 TaxID=1304272 RepID=A0ABV2AYX9_9GAMM
MPVKTPAWQSDPDRYDFRHTLALQYAHLDTIRHANNVAVHGLHVEARIRYQLAVLGHAHLFSDAELLRPRRTVTHFLRETHYPHDVVCATRLVAVTPDTYQLVTGLFQQGECVGVQDCLMGAWHTDRWVALPDDVYAALESNRAADDVPVNDWPQVPPEHVPLSGYPAESEISGRYADLDPDVVLGELAVSRYIEQSRAGSLRPIRNDPSLGMLVASVDLSYHRWHRGRADVQVVCGIDRIGNSSFALAGAAAVGEERLVTARSTMVLIDRDKRRPTPIDDALRASMAPLFIADESADDARAAGAAPGG